MRTNIILSAVVATVLAVAPLGADHHHSNLQRFDETVTVTGHIPHVSGGPADYFLTFSAPVGVPKATLGAGTYVFTNVAPSLVRVTSTDRRITYATFFTTSIYRTTTGHGEVTFRRDADGAVPRIVEIYRDYSSDGYAPVYTH